MEGHHLRNCLPGHDEQCLRVAFYFGVDHLNIDVSHAAQPDGQIRATRLGRHPHQPKNIPSK
jgi:hypothetical protein